MNVTGSELFSTLTTGCIRMSCVGRGVMGDGIVTDLLDSRSDDSGGGAGSLTDRKTVS